MSDYLSPPARAAADFTPLRRERVRVSRAMPWEGRLVLGSMATLLLVRFLTEGVRLLPRATTFIDVPIWLLLVTVAATHHRDLPRHRAFPSFFGPAMVLPWICILSVLLNISRVALAPVLLFLYDFLSPLGIFYAVYRLWPVGWGRSFTRLLVAVGVVQLAVVFLYDLPKFLSTKNPDVIEWDIWR